MMILESAVAGLEMSHQRKMTSSFELPVLTPTVPGLCLFGPEGRIHIVIVRAESYRDTFRSADTIWNRNSPLSALAVAGFVHYAG
jgi:hypothetical protein